MLPFSANSRLLPATLAGARDAVIITDARMDRPGPTILYVNDAFERLTGYCAAEAVGQTPRMLQGPRTDRAVLNRLRRVLLAGEEFSGEAVNYRRNGDEFINNWNATPVRGDDGEVTHYIAMLRDVTEQRRFEAIAGAVSLWDNVSHVLSGIRHEIGNPVNSMKSALTLMRARHVTYSPERINELIDGMLGEVARVEELLHALRGFNALEAPSSAPMDVASLLRRLRGLTTDDLEQRGIVLDVRVTEQPVLVLADARALTQVVLNLVGNACDALAGRDRPRVTIGLVVLPRYAQVVVSDNGIGMTNEQVDRALQPFFTTKVQGTGLGLPICQRLVAQMGGTFAIDSTAGTGTRVKLEFERVARGATW